VSDIYSDFKILQIKFNFSNNWEILKKESGDEKDNGKIPVILKTV